MSPFVFVYGTLRSEFHNEYARMLRAGAERVRRATVVGSIFRISSYPGYRPEPPGQVTGELYLLKDPDRLLSILDAWEGEEYLRVLTRASTGDDAWIYQFASQPAADTRIASGDFCAP